MRVFTIRILFAVALAAGSAFASELSNLGSPAGFDPVNGWAVDGGVVSGQMLAVAFTTDVTVALRDAQLALGIAFTNLSQSPFGVYLAADSGGLPGTDLADLVLSPGATVGPFPPGNLATYLCNAPCPVLQAGTQYWLAVDIPNLSLDYFETQAVWNWNTTLDYSTGANFAFNDTQFATGWVPGSMEDLRPAFQIDPAPEPDSIILALTGLGLILGGRRLRKRLSPARL
jgi:hypothetical protein